MSSGCACAIRSDTACGCRLRCASPRSTSSSHDIRAVVVVATVDPARLEVDDVPEVGTLPDDAERLVDLLLVLGHEDLRAGVRQEVLHLGRRVGGVDAHAGRPDRQRAHVGEQPLRTVLGVDGDPVAGLDAQVDQRVTDQLDPVPVVGPAHLLPDAEVLLPHRDPLRHLRGAVPDPGEAGVVRHDGHLFAEVRPDHLGVPLDLVGGSGADGDPEVHHHHPVGEVHHQPHVVLDHHDRDVQLVADVDDVAGGVLGLLQVHARHRLVEQEELGFHRQRPAELDALLDAVRQEADRLLAPLLDLEEVDDLLDEPPVGDLLLPRPPEPDEGGRGAVVDVQVPAEHQVVEDGEVLEERDVLEGAGQAQRRRCRTACARGCSRPAARHCPAAGGRRRRAR